MNEREEKRIFIERAQEGLAAAQFCLEKNLFHSATSRAYYAVFWAAQVALAAIGVRRSEWSHTDLRATFATELVKRRKRYPNRFGSHLNETLRLRLEADYRWKGVSRRQATRAVGWAREFVTTIIDKETSHDTDSPDT